MKKVLIVIGVLLAIVAAVLVYVLTSFDSIVKQAIETYGSDVTQTKVRVSDVNISLTSGEGTISGLRISNPAGFSNPNLFRLGKIRVKVDTDTVTQNPVIIDEVIIRSPTVFYEINKSGVSNVDILKKNIVHSTGGMEKPKASAGKSGEELKMIIRRLVIEGGRAQVKVAALGGVEQTVSIPRLQLTNIGKKSKGATAAEVARQIVKAMTNAVSGAVTKIGVGKYIGKPAELFKGAAKGVGGTVKGVLKGTGNKFGGAAEKAGSTLKGLLGN